MSRRHYLVTLIRLFLAQPGAPSRASRQDWAVAQTLYARRVDLADFAHAVRLATLRRLQRTDHRPPAPIRSLAYYRHVLDHLGPDERDPGYVDYVACRYADLTILNARSDRQNRALPDRR